ncbi:unnamed protein product [Mucor fragilis]
MSIEPVEKKEAKEDNEAKAAMMSMVKYLVRHELQFRASVAATSEASFAKEHLMPAIRRVLLQNASEELLYTKIDKPDFMIGTKTKKEVYFFFVEVKRPDTASKYQPEDDYAKLMKHMKGSIDKQLRLGVETPLSLGLLVKDNKYTK